MNVLARKGLSYGGPIISPQPTWLHVPMQPTLSWVV